METPTGRWQVKFDQPYLPELDPGDPAIAPFLHSAGKTPPANDELKLNDVGRGYNDMPAEVGLLCALLAAPETVIDKIADDLNSELFYDRRNREIVMAVMDLLTADSAVDRAAIIGHLKAADPETDYTTHLDLLYRCSYNPKHVTPYLRRLKVAERYRGGETYALYGFNEPFSALLFRLRVGPVKCVAGTWYQYACGVWQEKSRHQFRPDAMRSIHPRHRESKRITQVLDYIESACQLQAGSLCGAYKRVGDLILINAANGVVEVPLDGGIERLRAHSPDDGFTLQIPTSYEPLAKCPQFSAALAQSLPDADDRLLLQAFAGSVLYPGCEYETSLVCYGPGGTGKSTVLYDGIREVLGEKLCGSVGLEELCRSASYALPSLRNKMLNLASELNGQEVEESANFKKLVSGESMTVREIYGRPDEMATPCKLAFLSNMMPRFRAGSDAEVRRLRILHFNQRPVVQDIDLKARIRAESSGVLLWMLGGLHWLLQKRGVPHGGAAARAMLDGFRHGNDPIDSFLRERCIFDPKADVLKTDLTEAFEDWCQDTGQWSDKMGSYFYRTLHQRHKGVIRERRLAGGHRPRHLYGIGLKDGADWSIVESRPGEPSAMSRL